MEYSVDISLDINGAYKHQKIQVKQLDESTRKIVIELLKDGTNSVPSSFDSVEFRCKKSNGEVSKQTSEDDVNPVTVDSDGLVHVTLNGETLSTNGTTYCDLAFKTGDDILSSEPFIMYVVKSPHMQ